MKGIESVMRGYAAGGQVNPFEDYSGAPQAYNPFADLSYLSMQGRPQYAIRPPTITTPAASTTGGYRDIYGNLDAIKAAQAARKAAEAAAKVVPEAPGGAGEAGGGAGGMAETVAASPSGYNPPAISGYDTLGKVAGVAGLVTGLPLGPAATALSTTAAQDALRSYGIKDELSMKDALLSGLSFGLLGKSIDKQTMDILNQPANLSMYNEALLGMQGIPGLAEALESASKAQPGAVPADVEAMAPTTGAETSPGGDMGYSGADQGAAEAGGYEGSGMYAQGGYVPGKSGGMDDDVPAVIDGKQPARLSSGEFVFDAATVAALGDGNNQAGAKKLDGLRKAIRKKAYGHEKQPPQNYSVGDLVRMYDRRR